MSVRALFACAVAMLLLPAMALAETPQQVQQQPLEFTVTVHGDSRPTPEGSPSEHLMSFSGPIEIPGVGLPAGSYLFRFITPSIVQVTSPDRSTVYGMFLTTPASRQMTGRSGDDIREGPQRYTSQDRGLVLSGLAERRGTGLSTGLEAGTHRRRVCDSADKEKRP